MADLGDREIAAAVAADESWMETLLSELVAAPTVLGDEDLGQRVMREAFRDTGIEPRDLALDADRLRASPFHSPFSWDVSGKANVIADWQPGGTGGPSLALKGHIDVVPPPEPPVRTAPFDATRDGDWVYGRGAGDMKAGLVALVGAVRGLRRLGLAPQAPVQLQSVVEEECTGNGALQCVVAGPSFDAAVLTEPFGTAVSVAQVGVLWFHVDIAGAPAHVGEAGEGVNAIEASFPLVAALHRLEAELNEDPPPPFDTFEHPLNLNVGVIRGGDWPSTVASECTLSFRLALYPEMRVDDLQRRVEETIAAAASEHPYLATHPPRVRYEGFACAGVAVAAEEPVVEVLSGAVEQITGARPAAIASTATTDARAFVQHGIPAVCFGPHAEGLHGVDERVFWPSVVQTAQVLALFIRDWCGLA